MVQLRLKLRQEFPSPSENPAVPATAGKAAPDTADELDHSTPKPASPGHLGRERPITTSSFEYCLRHHVVSSAAVRPHGPFPWAESHRESPAATAIFPLEKNARLGLPHREACAIRPRLPTSKQRRCRDAGHCATLLR